MIRSVVAALLLVPFAAAQEGRPDSMPASRRAAFDAAADYSTRNAGRAVLVMVDEKIVYERYDQGWRADRAHPLASGTKSFSGVLAAAAVEDGLFKSFDERAVDTLTEWRDDPRKSKITLRHLLSLSSGLDPADDVFTRGVGLLGGERLRERALKELRENPPPRDFFAASLEVAAIADPGTTFRYGSSHYFAFGALLERKLAGRHAVDPSHPKTFTAYLRARVFDSIGLDVDHWATDRAGNLNLPGGAFLTAREWAKLGRLVLRGGTWPDGAAKDGSRRVVRRDLLEECFKPSACNPLYGLTWWMPGSDEGASDDADATPGDRIRAAALRREAEGLLKPDGTPYVIRMAAGLGKQRLFVVPELRLVVVRFAEIGVEGVRFSNAEFLKPIVAALAP
jgi:CubicO group peptidase (beta-lactamase class C family)